MEAVYAHEHFLTYSEGCKPSIFLAGPTVRGSKTPWREVALQCLKEARWDGFAFVPEPRDGHFEEGDIYYTKQVKWEWSYLRTASCVLFWVPRDLETLPGFTTNVEFGWLASERPERLVLGYPKEAPKMRYLHSFAENRGIEVHYDLTSTITAAMNKAHEQHKAEFSHAPW